MSTKCPYLQTICYLLTDNKPRQSLRYNQRYKLVHSRRRDAPRSTSPCCRTSPEVFPMLGVANKIADMNLVVSFVMLLFPVCHGGPFDCVLCQTTHLPLDVSHKNLVSYANQLLWPSKTKLLKTQMWGVQLLNFVQIFNVYDWSNFFMSHLSSNIFFLLEYLTTLTESRIENHNWFYRFYRLWAQARNDSYRPKTCLSTSSTSRQCQDTQESDDLTQAMMTAPTTQNSMQAKLQPWLRTQEKVKNLTKKIYDMKWHNELLY
jgi:hypothetical protein